MSLRENSGGWENDVHGPVYPVGNTHLPYYEDVTERFLDQGLEPEEAHIVTVGSDLVGWWLKDKFPESEVTTVEVNPKTSYMQNFAGNYLSRQANGKSIDELKRFLGIEDPSTGIPDFVDDGDIPEGVMEAHIDYVDEEDSEFDQVPDFSQIGFAWRDFYPEILDEIGFNAEKPDNHVIGDLRYAGIEEADAMYTNNVIDIVGRSDFYSAVGGILSEKGYLELNSEPGSYSGAEAFEPSLGLEAEIDPEVDFWWQPSPEEEKDERRYSSTVVLYSP